MAIRAVRSAGMPAANTDIAPIWSADFGSDVAGEDLGITTSAIASILPNISPGTWYPLADISSAVSSVDWTLQEADWTTLAIVQRSLREDGSAYLDLRLRDVVASFWQATIAHLLSFEHEDIWVRLG